MLSILIRASYIYIPYCAYIPVACFIWHMDYIVLMECLVRVSGLDEERER